MPGSRRLVVATPAPQGAWRMDRPGCEGALGTTPDRRIAVLHLVAWQAEAPDRLLLDPAAILPGAKRVRLWGAGSAVTSSELSDGQPLSTVVPATPWLVVELEQGDR